MTENYFEAHITFAPVDDERLKELKELASRHEFRVSDLLKRNNTTNDLDTFASARDTDSVKLQQRMIDFMMWANFLDFDVWRYKMEFTVFDSNFNDRFEAINK